jgi:TIR domain-containing protein/YARHG domain-containing protein
LRCDHANSVNARICGVVMVDIFISYSRDDRAEAEEVANFLSEKGYQVWWDADLVAGDVYREKIRSIIQDCKVAIVIWTESSIAKSWVLDEAGVASTAGKLIPVRADELAPEQIPYGFGQLQTVPLSDRGKLIDAVRRRFEAPRPQPGLGELISLRGRRVVRVARRWMSWKAALISLVVLTFGLYFTLDFLDWLRIQDSVEPYDYQHHLDTYPVSPFNAAARARLAGTQEWDDVKLASTADVLRNYIQKYPRSVYADFAQLRLHRLQLVASGGYKRLISHSSSRLLAEADLDELKCDQLWTARNEIYYALGYCFVSDAGTRAFNTTKDCPYRRCKMVDRINYWIENEILSETERKNVTAIRRREGALGCRFAVVPSACYK